ncbi:MAG: 5-(carboxyamino)imidazole ribonucleotide synthase [Rhodospirillales bacterium]
MGGTIGILGGGQLGRMAAMAAARLGYSVHVFSPEPDAPAAEVSRYHTCAAFDDWPALESFARTVQVITCEMEHVPSPTLRYVAAITPLRPGAGVFETCQDRVAEKTFLNRIGITTARWQIIESPDQIREVHRDGWASGILKIAFAGYDGKGQIRLEKGWSSEDIDGIWAQLFGTKSGVGSVILEEIVPFERELSVIVARDDTGQIAAFDAVENIHRNHILSVTRAPAAVPDKIRQTAVHIASTIADALDIRGVLAVEMFLTVSGDLLVNELAPRPHNSGHWTIDACGTDQFEQLIRAVCGLPLGQPDRWADAEMINLIGEDVGRIPEFLEMPNARLHLYGKREVRTGRKMGHVTIIKPPAKNSGTILKTEISHAHLES